MGAIQTIVITALVIIFLALLSYFMYWESIIKEMKLKEKGIGIIEYIENLYVRMKELKIYERLYLQTKEELEQARDLIHKMKETGRKKRRE